MEMKFGLLCDAANESREGKLNILGEFNTIWAGGFPVRWPRCVLVARFEAHPSEGQDHDLVLRLTDRDGADIIPSPPRLPIRFAQAAPDMPLRAQVVVNLDGMTFERPGEFEYHLVVDGHHRGSVPIWVRPRQKPAEA
ncbi:MAG TPA: hypothetical protein VGA70_05120 [Longimicrobiales bacterium]|jgi:hypothetical protein